MLDTQKGDVATESQSELYSEEEHLQHLHDGGSEHPKSSFSMDESSVTDFNMEIDEPEDLISYAGLSKRVKFENEIVIIENKNIFKNHKLKFQLASAMISLFFIGLVDQVIGSLIEYFLKEYNINRVQISYLFVAQFCGYIPSSIFNNYLMSKFGLHFLYTSACIIVCFTSTMFLLKVPFVFLPFCSVFFGWCNGTFDCCLNYFVGSLDYSNELLGLMHSMYGLGCLITPVLSIHLVKSGMPWNYYYFILIATGITNFLFAYFFFQNETAAKYRYTISEDRNNENDQDDFQSSNIEDKTLPTMFETLKNKYVIFYSVALFTYVGSELSVGVWLNNYMYRIQGQTEENASIITSIFWLFMTLGRGVMGFVTGWYYKDREIKGIVFYCFMVAGSCLSFWIFESSITLQIISICLAAWFVGPLFGTTIIISLKTLPKRYALHSISLIAGFGGTGAAIIPAILGYISEHFGGGNGDSDGAGLKYFPEVVCITFTAAAFMWFSFYLTHKRTFDAQIRLQ